MTMQTLAPPDARSLFERMRQRRVLVVGDAMVDEWIWGTVTRISPEAPVPVVAVNDHSFTLGGAGNVASNLRALDAEVRFAAAIGKDAFAHYVADILARNRHLRGGADHHRGPSDDAKDARRRA